MLLNLDVAKAICPNMDIILTSEKGLSIKGQVKEVGAPIPCRVRLFEKLSGRLVFDVETDENGFYVFNNLNQVLFYAITHHPLNQFNALIFDNLMPK